MSKLGDQLISLIKRELFVNEKQYKDFLARVQQDYLSREENPVSHFGVSFIPFDLDSKRLLIVDHKKAKQWLVPGGHVEKGESLEDTLKREVREELGLQLKAIPPQFMLSLVELKNTERSCRVHHVIWNFIRTR